MHELRRGGKKIALSYNPLRMHYTNSTSLHSDYKHFKRKSFNNKISRKNQIKKKQYTILLRQMSIIGIINNMFHSY